MCVLQKKATDRPMIEMDTEASMMEAEVAPGRWVVDLSVSVQSGWVALKVRGIFLPSRDFWLL